MPALTAEQLAERARGIGASEAAMALGLSPFGGPGDLQARKLAGEDIGEPTWAMRLGSIFEAAIAEAVTEREGWALRAYHRTIWHPDGLPLFATPDYAITGRHELLEIKKSERGEQWGDDGDPKGVPVHVVIQVQHQMACLPTVRGAWVAVLLYGRDLRLYPVERNPGQIAHLERALPEWWNRYVVNREPVDLDARGAEAGLRALYPHPTEEPRPGTEEEALLARAYLEANAAEAEAKGRKDAARVQLIDVIRGAAAVVGEGWKATFADQRGRIDWEAAARAAGVTEVTAEEYRAEPSRVLRVVDTAKKAREEA